MTFTNIERFVPDAEAQSSLALKRIPRPRFIKSHEYFDHRYRRVIYIVRDPRDIALSYYDFSRKYRHIEDSYPLESFVDDFIGGRLNSADWGTWGENAGTWLSARASDPNFLLLRYEDMIQSPIEQLARIAAFLAVDASAERLDLAVERSSASRMRELEQKQEDQWVSTKNRRKDIPFVGTAVSEKWKSKLPRESVVRIETAWGSLMQFLDYTLVTEEGQRHCHDTSPWWTAKLPAVENANTFSRSRQ